MNLNKSGDLIDVRYQKDIKAYAEWQAGNRRLNREYQEYEKMKAYYESKDETPLYTTLAGFKRARRADNLSPAYKAWRYRKIDEKQYECWKAIIGKGNMPEGVDKFQEI